MTEQAIKEAIFSIRERTFEKLALEIYKYQYKHNPVYRSYNDLLNIDPEHITDISSIPFLPISLFKDKMVLSEKKQKPLGYFESSGTNGQKRSRHYYYSLDLYEKSFTKTFEQTFGNLEQYCILGLLPSYADRPHASLAYMVQRFMELSKNTQSSFFLQNFDELYYTLQCLADLKQPVILFGVTFALIDFASKYQGSWDFLSIIETGGMKGRGEEWSKQELHALIKKAFGTESVYSEYGMTELFSQAYSKQDGTFNCPPWMKVTLREINDPFQKVNYGRGVINVIDLANIDSCSFIATEDVGEIYDDSSFRVLGRLDHAEWRGCSLMYI